MEGVTNFSIYVHGPYYIVITVSHVSYWGYYNGNFRGALLSMLG